MANILQTGATWLSGRLATYASVPVRYCRNGQEVALSVTLGKQLLRVADGFGGTRVEWTDADVIFPAADLALGGVTVEPRRGDEVRIARDDGKDDVYEVRGPDGEPPWRYSDPHHQMIRAHLVKVRCEP